MRAKLLFSLITLTELVVAYSKPGKFEILGNLSGGLATRNAPLVVESNAEQALKCSALWNSDLFVGGAISKRNGKTLANTGQIIGQTPWASQTTANTTFTASGSQGNGLTYIVQGIVAPQTATLYSVTLQLAAALSGSYYQALTGIVMSSSGGLPSGTIIGQSASLSNADSVYPSGTVTFIFESPISVTAGTTYYFGISYFSTYTGGQINIIGAYNSGTPPPNLLVYANNAGSGWTNSPGYQFYYSILSQSQNVVNGLYNFNVSTTGEQNVMAASGGFLFYGPLSGGTSWTQLASGLGTSGTWSFATLTNYLFSTDYATNTPRVWNGTASYAMQLGFQAQASAAVVNSGGSIAPGTYYIMLVTTMSSGGYRAVVLPAQIVTTSSSSITLSSVVVSGTGANDFGFDIGSNATTIFMTNLDGTGTYYQLAAASISVAANPIPNTTTSLTITACPTGSEATLLTAYTQLQQYFTDQVATPKAKYLCVWNNMLCMAGDPNNPTRVWFSQLDAPQIWSTYGGVLGNYVDVDINDGEYITGIAQWNGYLYIFKRHSVFIATFTGTATAPISVTQIPATMGTISHWTLHDIGRNGLFFLSEGGPYVAIGTYILPIPATGDILDRFNQLSSTSYNLGAMFGCSSALNPTKSQIWINVCSNGSSTYDQTLVFDYEHQVFWENDTVAVVYATVLDSNYFPHIWSSDYYGYVYQNDSGTNDNGQAINWYFTTPPLQLGDPFYFKQLLDVYVSGTVQSSGTLYVDVYLDNSSTAAQTLSFNMADARFKGGLHITCGQKARMFQLTFRNNQLNVPVEIDAIGLNWLQETNKY